MTSAYLVTVQNYSPSLRNRSDSSEAALPSSSEVPFSSSAMKPSSRSPSSTPEILVFDDSFSALDYKTDAKLREGLNEKLKDTTKIIVAQRISTIRHADKIIVLDRGEAVGMGTHDELMKNCDVYKEIALSQLSAAELA